MEQAAGLRAAGAEAEGNSAAEREAVLAAEGGKDMVEQSEVEMQAAHEQQVIPYHPYHHMYMCMLPVALMPHPLLPRCVYGTSLSPRATPVQHLATHHHAR